MAPLAHITLNAANVGLAIAGLIGLISVSIAVYNLFLHPLRRFPGPLLNRATVFPRVISLLRGRLAIDVLELHNKYGPVVRISPGELAFINPDAWRDIYGHRTGSLLGAEEFEKSRVFYRSKGIPPSIIAESRENHSLLRKQLSHGFSDRAMREQEPIINNYVSLLIQRLRENYGAEEYSDEKTATAKPKRKVVDIKSWYNWTTFDIIGDLAFGEPFGCLENVGYHPWVKAIATTIRTQAWVGASKLLRIDDIITPLFMYFSKSRNEHKNNTGDMLKRRMAVEGERHDLIEGLLKKKDDWNMDFKRLRVNAGLLVIAGSETTATLLTGATYLLLSNPRALEKLKAEVRSSFKSDDEITLTSVGNLTYMLACLNESLRRYPPVAVGMPRTVPKGGANVAGTFVPEGTTVGCWQWAINHSTENWEEPFDFRPERFIEGTKNAHDNHDALQPFSVGPRNCIGRNLAYAEMRLILARLLFNFDMELVDPAEDWLNQPVYTIWDKPPLNVYLTPIR